ncbi:MAG TPA: endonuclease/exonuclease/phosphatase family protein [Thermoanaerobaculia bacterium]|nr:endonuclease/exonuclease/phosphatase family protein [Thermoanaerobaculia bacterium]
MKIVSLNAWGGRLGAPLPDWLRNAAADVLCLQEVFSGPALTETALPDGDGHTIDADLFGSLSRALPGYRGWFSAGSRGYVNDSTWLDLPFEYGIALFVHPSISITAQRSALVHGAFRRDGSGSPPLSRPAQAVACVGPEGRFTLGHLHGLWQPDGKHDSELRLEQARRFRELIAGVADPAGPLIACGDFNVLPGSATFGLLGELGLRDLNRRFDIHCTRSSLYGKSVRYADYMLAGDGLDVERLEVVRSPEVSDHCPLVLHAAPAARKTGQDAARAG